MSKHYGEIAFYKAKTMRAHAAESSDALTEDAREFLGERDGFYLATVSETGWPYLQFRGGPVGFLRVIDEHTVGWPTFGAISNTSAPATWVQTTASHCSPWITSTAGG
jgi:uncharacterized protein